MNTAIVLSYAALIDVVSSNLLQWTNTIHWLVPQSVGLFGFNLFTIYPLYKHGLAHTVTVDDVCRGQPHFAQFASERQPYRLTLTPFLIPNASRPSLDTFAQFDMVSCRNEGQCFSNNENTSSVTAGQSFTTSLVMRGQHRRRLVTSQEMEVKVTVCTGY